MCTEGTPRAAKDAEMDAAMFSGVWQPGAERTFVSISRLMDGGRDESAEPITASLVPPARGG